MEAWGFTTYGDRFAAVYDRLYEGALPAEPAADFLTGLAPGGRVLELGVGTGRLAIPLAERGLTVHGIDASEAMVARLKEKPHGDRVKVFLGNFADGRAEGPYDLVACVFNTLFALTEQDEQVRCLQNAAALLSPDGSIVLECFVPDPTRFDRDQRVSANYVGLDSVIVDVARHDSIRQHVMNQHVLISGGRAELYPVLIRYAWPSELDLMARLAGLELQERWAGWRREPFLPSSTMHVSVYRKKVEPDR